MEGGQLDPLWRELHNHDQHSVGVGVGYMLVVDIAEACLGISTDNAQTSSLSQ